MNTPLVLPRAPMAIGNQRCDTCKHCFPTKSPLAETGAPECRRFPPVVVALPATRQIAALFPLVDADQCCGEWAPKIFQ